MKKRRVKTSSSGRMKIKERRYNVIMITLVVVLFGGYFVWLGYGIYKQERHDYIVRENLKSMPVPGAPIDPKMVCMVNNMYMGIDQIPVLVQNKTYYGCCDKCVRDLNEDETVRYAIDPFSNVRVDKALAFITMNSKQKGAILYFESKENAKRYFEND